jgi:hypothetical protein
VAGGAAAASALLLASCSLLGQIDAPTIFVTEPDNFAILAESPSEIAGVAFGQVDRITLIVDGRPAGRPEAGEDQSDWRLPITRALSQGVHQVRAVAAGARGTSADTSIFAISTAPFEIGFAPARLVVDRSEVRTEPWPARLGLIGPSIGDDYEVTLTLEDAGGLTFDVFPFDALESTADPGREIEPLNTGQWVFLDFTVPSDMPLGERQLVVRADGPAGTRRQRATLTVNVVDKTAPASEGPVGPVGPGG